MAGGFDKNRGNAETLRRYWAHGEGAAKVGWGRHGDFMTCVTHVSKYMTEEQAKGYCANRHHEATGEWPGEGAHKGHKGLANGVDHYDDINSPYPLDRAMILLTPSPETPAVPDGFDQTQMGILLADLGPTEGLDPDDLADDLRGIAAGIPQPTVTGTHLQESDGLVLLGLDPTRLEPIRTSVTRLANSHGRTPPNHWQPLLPLTTADLDLDGLALDDIDIEPSDITVTIPWLSLAWDGDAIDLPFSEE